MSDIKPYVIGIDPGLSGAIAYFKLDDVGELSLLGIRDMPIMANPSGKGNTVDCLTLCEYFKPFAGLLKLMVIERVNAMPTDGAIQAFKFGKTAMAPEALAAAFQFPLYFVGPAIWKRKAQLIKKPKGASLARAKTQWPEKADLFKLKKYEGRAEAALIGYFGYTIKGEK